MLRENFQEKTRENICAGLQGLGIDAQMAARGRVEEKITSGFSLLRSRERQLGLIDIRKGPIRWINVRKAEAGGDAGLVTPDIYYTDYGVPDHRIKPSYSQPWIKSVPKKTFPVLSKVTDLRWKGKDLALGVISRLNSDISIKDPIRRSCDVNIRAHGYHSCWIISTKTRNPPSMELWNCYQAIAAHLLAEWPPNHFYKTL